MRTLLYFLLLAMLVIEARAEAQAFPSVTVAQVATIDIDLAPATRYEWRAVRINGNASPIVHLVQNGTGIARAFSPGSPVATLRFLSVTGGPATLVIRTAAGNGAFDLKQRKGTVKLGLPVTLLSQRGVSAAETDVASLNGPLMFFETAHAPGGIYDPALIGLDKAGEDGRIVAYDRNSGVGNNAVVSHPAIQSLVLFQEGICVFAQPCDGPGLGRLYVNDRATDSDGDGLGDGLESALGTCPGAMFTCPVSPGAAKLVANPQDSDGDGLGDYQELFGVDDADDPQYLSRWGADPLHKDVFVEVDRRITGNPAAIDPANTFTDDDYRYIVESFLFGSSAGDLENPDGDAGISIHIDVGIEPTAQQLADLPGALTLFGDWGGSGNVPTEVGFVDSGGNYMADVRQSLFRHALLVKGESSTGTSSGSYFFWNGGVKFFVHELAHTLGLDHQGAPEMPNINCKPHHVSLINYQYDRLSGTSDYDPSRFSDGSRTLVMNPARVEETAGIGAPDLRFYESGSFRQLKDVDGGNVDWDFSGDFSGRNVRAPLTFSPSNVCGTSWKNPQSVATAPTLPAATPALARSGNVLFAFWVQNDGVISYSRSAVGGPDARGSCPLSDTFETECTAWRSPIKLLGMPTATSVDALALNDKVYVLKRASNGRLTITSFGVAGGALVNPSVHDLGERAAGEPEIAGIYYRATGRRTEVAIGIWYLAASRQVQQIVLRDDGQLSLVAGPQATEFVGPAGFVPAFAPSVEAWPDIANPRPGLGRNCMALAGADGIEMYCDYHGDQRFVHKQSLPLRDTVSKPSLEFRVHRLDSGLPLDGLGRKGNFWLAYVKPEQGAERTRVAVSQPFDGNGELSFSSAGSGIDWNFNFGGRQRVLSGSGVMLYMDDDTSALKGIAVQGSGALTTVNGTGQSDIIGKSSVTFLPFADGTFRVDMLDNNDWKTFARHMCRKLPGQTYCNAN